MEKSGMTDFEWGIFLLGMIVGALFIELHYEIKRKDKNGSDRR